MKNKVIIILIFWILFSDAAIGSELIMKSLKKCQSINDNKQRLQCFDEIGRSSKKVESSDHHSELENITQTPVLFADPEEPRIFASVGKLDFRGTDFSSILLGVGTRLKMKTFDFSPNYQNIDFNVIGLIKSQFDVSEISTRNNRGGALINTDFMVGGELVKPISNGSLRLKYAHRSTHLGDEFLIDNPKFLKDRLNLSYETVDLLAYHNINKLGLYYGASYIVRSEPGALGEAQVQAGFQYKNVNHGLFTPVFGIDLKSWQANDWHANISLKAGLEFSKWLDRPFQLLLEYYTGKSPYGQFIDEDLDYLGFSVNHYWE